MWNSTSNNILFFAVCVMAMGLVSQADAGGELVDRTDYCEQFADEYAGENGRSSASGIDLNSALAGAVDGVIVGEIVGDRENRRDYADAGAALSAVSSGIDFRPRSDRLYRRAFATCMAQ